MTHAWMPVTAGAPPLDHPVFELLHEGGEYCHWYSHLSTTITSPSKFYNVQASALAAEMVRRALPVFFDSGFLAGCTGQRQCLHEIRAVSSHLFETKESRLHERNWARHDRHSLAKDRPVDWIKGEPHKPLEFMLELLVLKDIRALLDQQDQLVTDVRLAVTPGRRGVTLSGWKWLCSIIDMRRADAADHARLAYEWGYVRGRQQAAAVGLQRASGDGAEDGQGEYGHGA